MQNENIIVGERTVVVETLEIQDPDVADFFTRINVKDRKTAFINAVQVGVFCLSRAEAGRDTDFIRRQIEALMGEVTRSVEKIPALTQEALLAKIGTANGQVLAPIQNLVDQASASTAARVQEIKDLLAQDIDPAKDSSTMGRALRVLRELLDPARSDSVQASVQNALARIASDDGPLTKSLKGALTTALLPIQREVAELAKEVRGRETVAEVIANTPLKGMTYEQEILFDLQRWARSTGSEVHHIGADNQSGDIFVRIPGSVTSPQAFSIVVEVRDRQTAAGRKTITDTLSRAMETRQASAAIYVSRHTDGLAQEIGDWAEGICERGRWIACTGYHTLTAIRFLLVQDHISRLRQASSEIDARSVDSQVQSVRTSLDRVKKISRRAGEVRGNADDIQQEAEILRDEVRAALVSIEDSLHAVQLPVTNDGILSPKEQLSGISSGH